MSHDAFIYDAIRTPRGRGKANGSLHRVKPVTLVTGLLHELLARHAGLDAAAVAQRAQHLARQRNRRDLVQRAVRAAFAAR